MKLKKVLSGFMAAVMAVTSSVVMTATAGAEATSLFAVTSGITADSAEVYFDLTCSEAVSWDQGQFVVSTWNNDAGAGDYLQFGYGGADQAQWWTGDTKTYTTYSEDLVNEKVTVDITDYDTLQNFEVLVDNSMGYYSITVNKVNILNDGEIVYTWDNPDLDTTEYAWQTIDVPSATWAILPGAMNPDMISGPNAGIEITLDLSKATKWAGFNIMDGSKVEAKIYNDCGDNPGSTFTQFCRFSDFVGDIPTAKSSFIINPYNDAELIGIRIKNEAGKTVYSEANAITINESENGEVTANVEEAAAGDEVTLTVTPAENYVLDTLTVKNGETDVEKTAGENGTYTFTMPDAAVTVSATFTAIDYTLTAADAVGGSISFTVASGETNTENAKTAKVGDDVTVIISADKYYEYSGAKANGVDVEECLFIMPAENVTVTPTFVLDTATLKEDVYQALNRVINETQPSTYTTDDLKADIITGFETINKSVALTVDTSALIRAASTETNIGYITGDIIVKTGDTLILTDVANVTISKVPTDPLEVAYEAIMAYLKNVTFDNDFHATNQSDAIKALVAEKAPGVRVDASFNVIVATYTDAGSVKGTISIKDDDDNLKTIEVNEVIAVLAKPDDMLIAEAKTAAEAAIKDIATADGITKDVIAKAIANDKITVAVVSEETTAPTTTATGVQTVTITLTLNKESATVTKTFDIEKLVAVTGVALDKTTAELEVGGTVTLKATVTPADAEDASVTWKSSDEKVATVKNGVVTAVAAGTATITVTTTDGAKTAECKVTVTAPVEDETEETPDDEEKPANTTAIWEGKTTLDTSWGKSVQISADKLADIKAGDTISIVYTADADNSQLKIMSMAEGWPVLTSPEGVDAQWGVINVTGTTVTFTVNAEDLAAIQSAGMVISGQNVTITKITSAAAKEAAGYEDSINPTLPEGVTATQKTAVVDGLYNQRIVKKVKAADLDGASKIVFTVSNGTKTAKFESTKCYSSLNVNGAAVNAGDDYVFLGLTIKDIPENITITIEGIEIIK